MNNVSPYTRNYFAGQHQELREWPIVPANKRSTGAFSAEGVSGSYIADAFGRICGILTGGTSNPNVTYSVDVAYATPISFIVKVLYSTERFTHAHLNPTLA